MNNPNSDRPDSEDQNDSVKREFSSENIHHWKNKVLISVCLTATLFGVVVLFVLLGYATSDSIGWLDWQFLTSASSRFPEEAGIYPALIGSIYMLLMLMPIAVVLGVGAAIYMEEYAPKNLLTRFINVNISNLAGVPSVVWGLLGLGIFVNLLNMEYGTLIVGSLTMALLVLPIVIIASQEALRSVSDSLRQASYGMGATRWQTIRKVVLPRALPGILTGTIIALARALGETAPLIMIGVPTTVFSTPDGPFSKFTTMTMQLFTWTDYPQHDFQYGVLAAGVVTLLVVLLTMNAAAILLRNYYQQQERL